MQIISCLGNPGTKYRNTRHNVGFLAGEFLAAQWGISIDKKNFNAQYGTGRVGLCDVMLLFPQTFMNLSGQSVQGALSWTREDAMSLIVLHDETEIPFGDIRFKSGGGHKGHNGLRSIIQCIGSSEFSRIRCGVGRPENEQISLADYVLAPFTHEEREQLGSVFVRLQQQIEALLV